MAATEPAPYSVTYEPSCRCLRFVYSEDRSPDHVDVPFGDVVEVVAVLGEDELHEIRVRTRSGEDLLAYRAPCMIARDFGLRFANNLGMVLSGPAADPECPDRMGQALERWVASVPQPKRVLTLDVALADVDARDRRDRSRADVMEGLSSQRGILAYCFTAEEVVGEGQFRLVLDHEGRAKSVRTVTSVGTTSVDACVLEALSAAPGPIATSHGRAWVTVGYQP